MSVAEKAVSSKKPNVVRDMPFARRLEKACEGNPHCPTDQHRGKQKWVYDGLAENFNVRVSPEAVRKWFAGESRPRPKIMNNLAQLLEVDEAWLSLGTKPDFTLGEKKVRNALADGCVNLVTGLIQMLGGHIAFPENPDSSVDLYAIIGGRQREIVVLTAKPLGRNRYQFAVDTSAEGKIIVGVVAEPGSMTFSLINIPFDLVVSAGDLRGGFYNFSITEKDGGFKSGRTGLGKISALTDFI